MILPSAKYQPYDALRQRLWYELLKQYDSDDTRTISHIELTSMLDSLGSTLSIETIDTFFTRWGKNPRTDELSIPEAIQGLETEICRPNSEKKRLPPSENEARERELGTGTDISAPHTPNLHAGTQTPPLHLDSLNFSGPALHVGDILPHLHRHPARQTSHSTEPMQTRVADHVHQATTSAPALQHPQAVRQPSTSSSLTSDTENTGSGSGGSVSGNSNGNGSGSSDEAFERVINVKNCPLCHRPRLNSKGERDIVTHLAVCASQNWASVNHVMVGNFVTPLQAQRKWYTNVLSKVSAGNYKIGAVCGLFSLRIAKKKKLKLAAEFCKHHCTESYDWPAGGREDAGVRAARHSPTIQGECSLSAVSRHIETSFFSGQGARSRLEGARGAFIVTSN